MDENTPENISFLQKYDINWEILKYQVISLVVNWERGKIVSSISKFDPAFHPSPGPTSDTYV